MVCNKVGSSLHQNLRASVAIGLVFLMFPGSESAFGQSEDTSSPPVVADSATTAPTGARSEEPEVVYAPVVTEYRSPEPDLGFIDRLAYFFGFERRERLFSPPIGSSLREHVTLHRLRGRAARALLYDYDFQPGSSELRQRGQEKLQTFADWVMESGVQVVVEHTPRSPKLATARKQTVVVQLLEVGITNAADFVMVGRPLVRAKRAIQPVRFVPRNSSTAPATPPAPAVPPNPVAPQIPALPQTPGSPGAPPAPAPGPRVPTLSPGSFQTGG